jgi:hypothetical protein
VISKKAIALCAAAGVAVSGLAMISPANAEPAAQNYAIVGSDTLEDVVGALVNGTKVTGATVQSITGNVASGSFDATGTPYIITKSSGIRFGRPNGSGDGRNALKAAINGDNSFAASQQYLGVFASGTNGALQPEKAPAVSAVTLDARSVDLARSSSASTVLSDAGIMTQIPFGRDAIGYVYDSKASGDCADLGNLTVAELKQIFEGTKVAGVYVQKCGHDIHAMTPQTGSGTGKDWAGMIGANGTTVGNSYAAGGANLVGQEHDAMSLPGYYVMPMSASRWIAMHTVKDGQTASYIKYKNDANNVTTMGQISGVSPVINTNGVLTPNPAYYYEGKTYNSVTYPSLGAATGKNFGRDTYIVAPTARITPGASFDQGLADLVDATQDTSLTNQDTSAAGTAGSVKLKYGFLHTIATTSDKING